MKIFFKHLWGHSFCIRFGCLWLCRVYNNIKDHFDKYLHIYMHTYIMQDTFIHTYIYVSVHIHIRAYTYTDSICLPVCIITLFYFHIFYVVIEKMSKYSGADHKQNMKEIILISAVRVEHVTSTLLISL